VTALDAAAAALARRDRSAAGLASYLEQRGTTPEDALEAVDRLRGLGYLDDERFACRRAEVLAERGRGDAAIRHELEREGVGSGDVDVAIAALAPEEERASIVVRRAGSSAAGARRLIAGGFSADAIEAAVTGLGPVPREGDDYSTAPP
jgi:SOS response regulatory protein OraA/RecX